MKAILVMELLGTSIAILAFIIAFIMPLANAQVLSPSSPQELTDLEKKEMQTIYEDDKKKIMLPYDPERVMMFIMIAIILSFTSGLLAGIAIQKYWHKPAKDI